MKSKFLANFKIFNIHPEIKKHGVIFDYDWKFPEDTDIYINVHHNENTEMMDITMEYHRVGYFNTSIQVCVDNCGDRKDLKAAMKLIKIIAENILKKQYV